MTKRQYPTTQAVRELKNSGVEFSIHLYDYVEHGGTKIASEQLSIAEHLIIKTVVLEDDNYKPVVVLMHGDREDLNKKSG